MFEETPEFLGTQDFGKLPLTPGKGNVLDHLFAIEGHVIEEAKGTDRLVEQGPGRLLCFHQIDLVFPDVLSPQYLRGFLEMFSEFGDRSDVCVDGSGRVVADPHVLSHSLTQ